MKLRREHKLKIVSLFIAVTLWYFVVWGKAVEKTLEIPITYKMNNSNYLVEINPSTAVIKVEAIRRTLRTVQEREIKVEVDLKKYSPGVYQIRFPVEKVNLPTGIKIKEISPPFITVVIKKISTKKVPVEINLENSEENLKHLVLKVEPRYVIVRAPSDVLETLDRIYTEPLSLFRLKVSRITEASVIYPSEVISITPDRVKVIYQERSKSRK